MDIGRQKEKRTGDRVNWI
jgi:hypothetical protein